MFLIMRQKKKYENNNVNGMSMAWFDKTGAKGASAYIVIDMGIADLKQYMVKPFLPDKLKIPVLNFYGLQEVKRVKKLQL